MRNIADGIRKREKVCYVMLTVMSICICILSCQLYEMSVKKVSSIEPLLVSDLYASNAQTAEQMPLFYVKAENDAVKAQDLREQSAYILLKNIDVRSMRNADRERFEFGFYLYSEDELRKLLEDYSS